MRRYENVKISALKPYENNARTHSQEQVEKIANSIKEFGFINPVLIDSDYGIIAGHGRVLAGQLLGMEEVPCLFIEDLTETQKRAYILADNKLALDAGWDDEILRQEILALDKLDFDVSFVDVEFETYPEDVIVMFTDGITESKNKDGIDFGKESLISLLQRYSFHSPQKMFSYCNYILNI